MKKIFIASMMLVATAAFADVQGQKQDTKVDTSSAAVSTSNGGVQGQQQGQQQGIAASGNSQQGQQQGIAASGNSQQGQQQGISKSGNSMQGQQQGIKDSGNSQAAAGVQQAGNSAVTVGCLVNCADNGESAKDLADSAVAAAAINAQAARDVADKNGETARAVAGTTQTIKNTPSIGLSQLTSSNDTCMGSVSVGGSGPGFSIGVGTTYTDENCKMLKNSRELWNMGMKAAAMALMCTNEANKQALELTGFKCPQTAAAKKTAQAEQVKVEQAKVATTAPVAANNSAVKLADAYTGNDPIVQARLGLTSTASK